MIAHYTQAAMVAENRRLAAPASVDSLPTSAMQEDHVSMAWSGARKLRHVLANLGRILGVELACAARGLDLRAPLEPAPGTAAALARADGGAGPGARPVARARARRGRASGRVRGLVEAVEAAIGVGMRDVRAPRGTELSCRSWQQEAALRMLMNNLDPEVAERPEELVVYGGTGRAARSWEAFDAIVESLRRLGDDETLLVQSGKPVGSSVPTSGRPGADRELPPRSGMGDVG